MGIGDSVCGHPGTQRTSKVWPALSGAHLSLYQAELLPSKACLNVKLRLFPARLGIEQESSEKQALDCVSQSNRGQSSLGSRECCSPGVLPW